MSNKQTAKEIDPEVMLKRKFRAKCLFRALGRLCMANVFWLIEDVEEYEGLDVKRRVEQAVRSKAKKHLLSVKDKGLLNKPAGDRTEHEKKYIYRIIGGLKCFKRYPNRVKRKLAAVTYFKYYGPNRVIVRQHQEAHALYFLVSGAVSVSQKVYDELLEEYVIIEVGTMGPGDMFGEVSLLHNIPRTATVTTTDHCELLQVLREDFNIILLTCVQKQWDEVRLAMSSFTYFDSLDQVAFREGCIVTKMKKFNEHETILGDGCGVPNHVYFVLSGRVQMIETLQIFVTKRLSKTFYTLYDPYVAPEPCEEDFEKKWFAAYNKKSDPTVSGPLPKRELANLASEMMRTNTQRPSILKSRGLLDDHRKSILEMIDEEAASGKKATFPFPMGGTSALHSMDLDETRKASVHRTSTLTIERRKSSAGSGPDVSTLLVVHPPDEDQPPSARQSIQPVPGYQNYQSIRGRELKTYFMQVCIMNPGSTFGFGENMRDRRMVALTPVTCMLIPKIWLLQHNSANIWTRIEYYLGKKIPTKQKLFEEFCKQQEWEEYKSQVVDDVVARSKTVNFTSMHDVPYSIRFEELDI